MKKLDGNHAIKTISITVLSIVAIVIIIAIFIKIDEYKRSFFTIDVKFKTNDVVKLYNKLPVSDTIGKGYSGSGIEKGIIEYKEFTVTNPNDKKIKYEISVKRMYSTTKDMRSNYVNLYLTDENDKPVKGFDKKKIVSYYDLVSLNDDPGSRFLYSDYLDPGVSKTFILRSWVADTYILSNIEEGFGFDIDVRLK